VWKPSCLPSPESSPAKLGAHLQHHLTIPMKLIATDASTTPTHLPSPRWPFHRSNPPMAASFDPTPPSSSIQSTAATPIAHVLDFKAKGRAERVLRDAYSNHLLLHSARGTDVLLG